MAQEFRSQGTQITNTPTTIYTAGAYDAVIGIRLANTHTAAITISAQSSVATSADAWVSVVQQISA